MENRVEKRQEPRWNVSFPLLFKRDNSSDIEHREHEGLTQNISEGGLYFICPTCPDRDMDVNHKLDITIIIPSQWNAMASHRHIKTKGKIVRIHKYIEEPHTRGVALKFSGGVDDLIFC
jgi:hypothetical protein